MGGSAKWSALPQHPHQDGTGGTPQVGTFWTLLLRDYRSVEPTR
jgi:hypothetical protein